jgi:hypothetical protein
MLVAQHGEGVLQSGEDLRGVLDDYFDESQVNVGQLNLFVDAVRMHALDRLRGLVAQGADPRAAVEAVGGELARDRSGDARTATWAVAALGYALDAVPEEVVLAYQARSDRPHEGATHADAPTQAAPPPSTSAAATVKAPSPAATTPAPGPSPGTVPSHGPVRPTDPQAQGPRRGRLWIILAAAAAVLAVLGVVVVVTDGDDTPSGSDDTSDPPSGEPGQPVSPSTLADTYATLGAALAEDVDECTDAGASDAADQRVRCRYRDLEAEYTTWTDEASLTRQRNRLLADLQEGSGVAESSTSEQGSYLLMSDRDKDLTWLYWDSNEALQSGYLEAPWSQLSAQGARDWFDQRASDAAVRVLPFDVPEPFSSPFLWELAEPYVGDATELCEREDRTHTPMDREPLDIAERIVCENGEYSYFFVKLGIESSLEDTRGYALEDAEADGDSGTWSRSGDDVYAYPVTGRWIDSYKPNSSLPQVYFDVDAQDIYGFVRGPDGADPRQVHDHWEHLTARAAESHYQG